MIIVRNKITEPEFNLALEEILLKETDDDVFMLWQNRRAVIVGRNQNTVSEIDGDYAAAQGISVVRRLTGGGAVFHDAGNVNFTFIRRGAADRFLDFEYFNRPIIAILRDWGLPAVSSVRNDITIDGKKVSGNAQTRQGSSVLHHGTMMFSVDLSLLSGVLKPHPLKIRSKAIASVRSRVANISDLSGGRIDPQAFIEKAGALMQAENPDAKVLDISGGGAEETGLRSRAEALKNEKYSTWEWNYGYSPAYQIETADYGAAGLIEVKMDVRDGKIAEIRFSGDFSGLRPVSELAARLTGVNRERDALTRTLRGITVSEYISGLDSESLTKLLMRNVD